MQTTLLSIGIAIILALVAALVGPYFINWSDYRGTFETRASAMLGKPVRITGPIDARLLPVPSVMLRGVEVGNQAGGPVKIRELSIELALGSLMRGEWRATELRLAGPEVALALDDTGRLAWSGASALNADALSVERLSIEDGRIAFSDAASGVREVLDGFWFNGDLRSLAGPIRGEGGFVLRNERHGYRVSAGRYADDGMRLRLTVDAGDRPIIAEADGALRFEDGGPRFEGALTLTRTPAAQASGGEPWRLSSKVQAASTGMLLEQVELQYGPEERGLKFTGTADFKFGRAPQLEAVLSARQLDLDRLVALPEETRRLPIVALRTVMDALGGVAHPGIPVRLGFSIDALTVGGANVQALRGDVVTRDDGWGIETVEFRAPGFAQVRASGMLTLDGASPSFKGPASIESADPKALLAWLEGRAGAKTGTAAIGPLRASGDLSLAAGRVAIERLRAEIDRKSVSGRIDYVWAAPGRKPRLDASFSAAEFDLDAAIAAVRGALPGASYDQQTELALALDIGRMTFAGIEARRIKGKLRFDAQGLALDHLVLGELAGAAIEVNGQIEGPWTAPRGNLAFDLAGSRLDGLIALAQKFVPQFADPLRAAAPYLNPAKLHLTLAVDHGAAGGVTASARAQGTSGAFKLDARGDFAGDPAKWREGALTLEIGLAAADGRALTRLLMLDGALAVGPGAGSLHVSAKGAPGGDMRVDLRVAANGLEAASAGTLRIGDDGVSGTGTLTLKAADALALSAASGRMGLPVKVTAQSKLALTPARLDFADLTASVAGATINGRLGLVFGERPRLDGALDADAIDGGALVAAMFGAPQGASGSVWSAQPLARRFLAGFDGAVTLRATRAALTPTLEVRQLEALLRFGAGESAIENIKGALAGGKLAASVILPHGAQGASLDVRLALSGADIAGLLPGEARAPASGKISVSLEAKSAGRSVASLVGALGGAGTVSFENVELVGFEPRVFDTLTRAVDQGLAIEVDKVQKMVERALAHGRLRIARADGALSLTAGRLRLASLLAKGDGADFAIDASLDLSKLDLDARLALIGASGPDGPAAGRPEIFVALKGPLASPRRSVDVSALVGWLTLRAVELQAKRLEVLEAERRAEEATRAARLEALESERRAAEAARAAAAAKAARATAAPAAGPAEKTSASPAASPAPAPAVDVPAVLIPDVPPARQAPPRPSQPEATQAPALPPPIDIRPAPTPRRAPAASPLRRRQDAGAQAKPPPATPSRRLLDLFGAAR